MPGSATISSGYTSQLQSKASYCDQERILARLQGLNGSQRPVPSNSRPPTSSVLELKSQAGCPNPIDVLAFPKKSILSSAYTRSLEVKINSCAIPFKYVNRCCPPPTITNAGMPKPSVSCSYTSDQNLNTKIT